MHTRTKIAGTLCLWLLAGSLRAQEIAWRPAGVETAPAPLTLGRPEPLADALGLVSGLDDPRPIIRAQAGDVPPMPVPPPPPPPPGSPFVSPALGVNPGEEGFNCGVVGADQGHWGSFWSK